MIAFVIPLRSKAMSKNWERVSQQCLRTIGSLLQQTASDYKIFLVCNEPPEGLRAQERVIVISRDFPIPENKPRRRHFDKLCKMCHGLVEARRLQPTHYMIVDADDCVSRRLAEFVKENSSAPGWYVDKGWIYHEHSRWIQWQRRNFHRVCGTSVIAPFDLERLPKRLDEDFNLYRPHVEHNRIVDTWSAVGKTLHPLPFAGAVYILGTGENLSGETLGSGQRSSSWKRLIKSALWSRPLTSQLSVEFGLSEILSTTD